MGADRKTWCFRLLLAVGAPLAAVAVLECGLRVSGVRSAPLVRATHGGERGWKTNPAYSHSVFPREASPALPPLWIPERKPEGQLRILVLGESAAEGFPLTQFNLARVLETVVRSRNPAARLRVYSLAMAGINSHQIRRIGLAAGKHLDPDVVVLYVGNNEVVGPYGPAAVMAGFQTSLPAIRARQALRELALARVADGLIRRLRSGSSPRKAWGGLDEFRGVKIAFDDPRLEPMYAGFDANLRDLVGDLTRRGVRVVLCTMGVNLTDWPPMASEPEPMPERFRADLAPAPETLRSAVLAYRWAETLRAANREADAWAMYRRARDLDLVRFRADSRINDLLRTLGRGFAGDRLVLADVARLLHEDDPAGGDDASRFFEHVHLTVPGRILVAGMLADSLDRAGWVEAPPPRSLEEEREAVSDLLIATPMDELQALTVIREFYRWPHFSGQLYAEERLAGIERELKRMRAARKDWNARRLRTAWEVSRARDPIDPWRDAQVGEYLLAMNDPAGAREALESALAVYPDLLHARADAARACLRTGDTASARRHIDHGLRLDANHPATLIVQGEWALQTGRLREAESALTQAHRLLPKHIGILINLARVAEAQQHHTEAETWYRQGLQIDPEAPHLLNNLAALLLARPDAADEARNLALRAVERDGASPYVWWTLARAEAQLGRWDDARAALGRARELAKPAEDGVLLKAFDRAEKAWAGQAN